MGTAVLLRETTAIMDRGQTMAWELSLPMMLAPMTIRAMATVTATTTPKILAWELAGLLAQVSPGLILVHGVDPGVLKNDIRRFLRAGAFPQGQNLVTEKIPVAMISEMLLNPGGEDLYSGQTHTLPDARLVWWAGGNPFHHHQDLARLHAAFQTPETVIVNGSRRSPKNRARPMDVIFFFQPFKII